MKLPVPSPTLPQLIARHPERIGPVLALRLGAEVKGRYEHWDHLRHLTPPPGLTGEEW